MAVCAFCQILHGEAAVSLVYSDDRVAAFMDVQPVNPGHVLVVPRVHVALLSDLDEETGGQMFKSATRITKAVREVGLQCEGVNLYLADGQVAGQEVLHVHLHIIRQVSLTSGSLLALGKIASTRSRNSYPRVSTRSQSGSLLGTKSIS